MTASPDAPADGNAWSVVDSLRVRPYAVAGGRTRSRHSDALRLETVVEPGTGQPSDQLLPEAQHIVALCATRRRSIAELAGTLGQPVPVVQILVSDLLDTETLLVPASVFTDDQSSLEAVLMGLKKKWGHAES